MVMVDILLASIALLGLGAASVHDLKTREVPDWITYGLIIAGFGIRLIAALGTESWFYFFSAFIGLGITYGIGSLMYYTKQWGGGDAKMIMALGVIFATRPAFIPSSSMPFLGILFVNILLIGALYGLLWGFILAWKNRRKFVVGAKRLLEEKSMIKTRIIAVILALITFVTAFISADIFFRITIMTFALLIVLYPYVWVYVKAIEKSCLYKKIKPEKLTEGDWVESVVVNKRIVYKTKNTGIEKEDIQKLLRLKVRQVIVKEGIPFIPSFLLGTIITLLQWNILNFI